MNKKGSALSIIALLLFALAGIAVLSGEGGITGAAIITEKSCKQQCEDDFALCSQQNKDCKATCERGVSGNGQCKATPCDSSYSNACPAIKPVNGWNSDACGAIGCYWCSTATDSTCKKQCETAFKSCEGEKSACKTSCDCEKQCELDFKSCSDEAEACKKSCPIDDEACKKQCKEMDKACDTVKKDCKFACKGKK